jgi:hypothetical protein
MAIMETAYAPSRAHTRPLPKGNRHETNKEAATTPKEQLHTVEEFVEKLEQAVLERL